MKYSDRVLKHPIFVKFVKEIKTMENGRAYCHHELEHAIDVARLAWICYLEDKIAGETQNKYWIFQKESFGEWIDECEEMKDLFYTCALLHDIGRVMQYKTGVHHSIAGLELTKTILEEIQTPKAWNNMILDVVAEHSQGEFSKENRSLEYYIMKADHDCRLCFACEARESCKWTEDEMNDTVVS